jgi:CubicO group peptidase (beta-lactamase class C family)
MPFSGFGFGLGFSVLQDPIAAKTLSSAGEFAWDGAASTAFWVDPDEEVTVLFFTQLLPSSTHPIRKYLRQLVYQGSCSAVVDLAGVVMGGVSASGWLSGWGEGWW